MFIDNSFRVVLSKPQCAKSLSKTKRRRHWNLPFSETISRVSLKQPQQYLSPTPRTLASPDRAVRVQALARDTVLCPWARHLTLTVPLST